MTSKVRCYTLYLFFIESSRRNLVSLMLLSNSYSFERNCTSFFLRRPWSCPAWLCMEHPLEPGNGSIMWIRMATIHVVFGVNRNQSKALDLVLKLQLKTSKISMQSFLEFTIHSWNILPIHNLYLRKKVTERSNMHLIKVAELFWFDFKSDFFSRNAKEKVCSSCNKKISSIEEACPLGHIDGKNTQENTIDKVYTPQYLN